MSDLINPSYYADLDPEPIEVWLQWWPDCWRVQVSKYATRGGKKPYPGMTQEESLRADIGKAQRWLEAAKEASFNRDRDQQRVVDLIFGDT
jgi:hypothetical protein